MLFFGQMRKIILSLSVSLKLISVGALGYLYQRLWGSMNVAKQEKNILVIANGPSLNHDLPKISRKNFDAVVAVNYFAATAYFTEFKPDYYFIQDPFWFDNIENLTPKARGMLEGIIRELSWPMQLIFPSNYLESEPIKKLSELPLLTLVPLPQYRWPGFHSLISRVDLLPYFSLMNRKLLFRLWDRHLTQILSNGVVQTALFELIRSGIKNIDVLGLDMSMGKELHLDKDGTVNFYPVHFYGAAKTPEEPLAGIKENSMAASYRAIAQKFEVFYLIEEYARARGATITNLSSDSNLDAFKKILIKTN